jgi:hypothetical protein
MIATLFVLQALTAGTTWDYDVKWRYVGDGIDTTDQELMTISVKSIGKDNTQLAISQKLTNTIQDGGNVPAPSGITPLVRPWTLFENRSVAFMPEGRFPMESRLFRIFKAILPQPVGTKRESSDRTLVDFEATDVGLPAAAVMIFWSKPTKEGLPFLLSYREKSGVNVKGDGLLTPDTIFPSRCSFTFGTTQMPGGSDPVTGSFSMNLIPPVKK